MALGAWAINAPEVFLFVDMHGADTGLVALRHGVDVVPLITNLVVAAVFPVHGVVLGIFPVARIHYCGHVPDTIGFFRLEAGARWPVDGKRDCIWPALIVFSHQRRGARVLYTLRLGVSAEGADGAIQRIPTHLLYCGIAGARELCVCR